MKILKVTESDLNNVVLCKGQNISTQSDGCILSYLTTEHSGTYYEHEIV